MTDGIITLSFWDLLLRLSAAVFCGGIIGIERGRKHRPAGFRTHMLVCLGAALTMVLGNYYSVMLSELWQIDLPVTVDVSRFGAQVINGIGFLGAGTIIVTGKQQVKGMTTAAGLWAAACMGIAIGAGFYTGALIGSALIIITVVLLSKLEAMIMSKTRNISIYIEFESIEDLASVVEKIRSTSTKIFDIEISKVKGSEQVYPGAVFSLLLPKKTSHTVLMAAIAESDKVRSIEEL